ncbi:MAG: nuclear transport factor 2 family protein [Cyanobacteria bacterium P01_A01_bin.114]
MSPQTIETKVNDYFTALSSRHEASWLALFADDGIICDPVGSPPKLVKQASAQFFALLQQFYEQLTVTPQAIFIAGEGAAAQWQMQVLAKNGQSGTAAGISVFEFNGAGQLQKVSSYWDESALMAQLKA